MDVAAWLEALGLEQYASKFHDNAIDAEVLRKLSAEDLKEIGIAALGHRKRLLEAIAALQSAPSGILGAQPLDHDRHRDAERRQLTVTFVDLVGSTALASRLDPEEMQDVLKAFQKAAAGEILRYEGHIAKFMGDGILAYFGWPRAHEDEAERAARAGLALVAAVARLKAPDGEPLACRVGIATGLVVVGDLVGNGAAQEEAVVGETPNLAARLQQLANPGTAVIAEGTRRLLGGLFDVEELAVREIKGFSGGIRAFRVLGEAPADSRFDARQAKPAGPMVGREQELALLLGRWEQAARGDGQVVLLVGEPGIGKSRIALALRQSLTEATRTSLQYHCSPYHRETALWPVIEQLERAAELARNDDAETRLEKLERLLSRAGEGGTLIAPFVARLLDIPTDSRYPPLDLTPPVLRARTLELLLSQIVGLARQQPVLITLEDAHWIDPTSRELFGQLLARIRSLPVFLVVTVRPELMSHWSGFAHVTTVFLNRLGASQTSTIIGVICKGKTLPQPVLEQILARTDGVPLFVEELTRAVLESGLLREMPEGYVLDGPLTAVAIPATLQDSLMARLDRLNPVKVLAQTAACIGRIFTGELLGEVAGLGTVAVEKGLERLVEAELIHPRGAAGSYAFKHALVQELAQQSLLKARRRELHLKIARAIEIRHPETAKSQPEILSYHYTEADLPENAAAYRIKAGRLAKARHATLEATAHLEACLQLCSRAGSIRPEEIREIQRDAWLLLGDLASLADDLDRANGCYDQALPLAAAGAERSTVLNRHHRLSYVSRNSARVAYYEHGSGQPSIVFVNPIVYGLATFQPILERLCDDFRVITIDCRGAGRSDPLMRPYGIGEHAEDLRAIIEAADAAPIVGVGISRGSNQLLHLTYRYPALVSKLIVVGTPAGSMFFNPEYWRLRAEAYERQDVDALIRLQAEFVYTEDNAAELRRIFVDRCRRLPRETVLSFYDPDPEINVEPILGSIMVPTLVVHGREDRINEFAASEHIAARIPGSRLYAFEGKGHLPMFSATDAFCELIKQFTRTGGTVHGGPGRRHEPVAAGTH